MDDTETFRQADLDSGAIAAAHALSTSVDWNQTAEDWALFIVHGRTIGVRDRENRLIATAATFPYDAGFGWISMVIVAPAWRRRGIARRLMNECIETLHSARRDALLDATPAGAEVYSRLGFVALDGMERWEGAGGAVKDRKAVPPLAGDRLIAADLGTFGADRGFLLRDFLARDGARALAREDAALAMRRGQRATQIGPFIAASEAAAASLLAEAIDLAEGPVFLDLMNGWKNLTPLLEARDFRRQRPFRRMALGRNTLPGDPARLVCAAGPEFG